MDAQVFNTHLAMVFILIAVLGLAATVWMAVDNWRSRTAKVSKCMDGGVHNYCSVLLKGECREVGGHPDKVTVQTNMYYGYCTRCGTSGTVSVETEGKPI